MVMDDTEFEPGQPGRRVPVPRHCAGTPKNRERHLTPQTALEAQILKILNPKDGTSKLRQQQTYPIRWLKQRYGISRNCAAFVADEFRWEGA